MFINEVDKCCDYLLLQLYNLMGQTELPSNKGDHEFTCSNSVGSHTTNFQARFDGYFSQSYAIAWFSDCIA